MKVTAYIPCYNARATINAALRSIREQSVAVSETFIVDDGSTDGSGDLTGSTVVRLPVNKGRGAARAKAMAEASHELVLGCDATLTLDRHFLENALPWFASEQVAAVFGWVNERAPDTVANRWRGRHLFRSQFGHPLAHFASLATGCSVVRKSVVARVGGFNAALRACEDADLGQRLLGAGFDVVFEPKLWATSVLDNSVMEVMERYARWNSPGRMSLLSYIRQLNYAVKVMAAKDLEATDPCAVWISLLVPHYQFWRGIVPAGPRFSTFRESGEIARHK